MNLEPLHVDHANSAQSLDATPWHLRPPARSAMGRCWQGWAATWHGWLLLMRSRGLWWFAVVPMLLNVVISIAVFAVLIAASYWAVEWMHASFAGQMAGWRHYIALVAEAAVAIAMFLMFLLAALVLWKILTTALCGFFFGKLAEQVERQLGVEPGELRPVSSGAEAAGLVLSLAVLAVGSIALMALVFVPVVGGILAFVIGTGFTFWIMGLDYLGYPLALRGLPRWLQYPYGLRNGWTALGLGAFVSLCELIPIFGAVPLTTAVIGAVLLQRKLQGGRDLSRRQIGEAR